MRFVYVYRASDERRGAFSERRRRAALTTTVLHRTRAQNSHVRTAQTVYRLLQSNIIHIHHTYIYIRTGGAHAATAAAAGIWIHLYRANEWNHMGAQIQSVYAEVVVYIFYVHEHVLYNHICTINVCHSSNSRVCVQSTQSNSEITIIISRTDLNIILRSSHTSRR